MATYEELMQSAEQIRTNELPESNTHQLVGQHLKNQVEYSKNENNGLKTLIDNNKKEVDGKLTELGNSEYVVCETSGNIQQKAVRISGFNLNNKARFLVKMNDLNIATDAILRVDSDATSYAKPLFYNGKRARADNSWVSGAVLDVYYDGENFQTTDFQGGSANSDNESGDKYKSIIAVNIQGLINADGSDQTTSTAWSRSDYISVSSGDTVEIKGDGFADNPYLVLAVYDSEKTFLSGYNKTDYQSSTKIESDGYIRVSKSSTGSAIFSVSKFISNEFDKLNESIYNNAEDIKAIKEDVSALKESLAVEEKEVEINIPGYIKSDGTFINHSLNSCTDYLEGTEFVYTGSFNLSSIDCPFAAFYDVNKQYLKDLSQAYVRNVTNVTETIKMPSGASFVRFVSLNNATVKKVVVKSNKIDKNQSDIQALLALQKEKKIPINKNIVYVGMSIWWYNGQKQVDPVSGKTVESVRGYQSLLEEQFNFLSSNATEYSYSGNSLGATSAEDSASIALKKWTKSIENAIWTLDTITNDFKRNIPIGTIEDYNNNTGATSYYGALRIFKDKVDSLSANAIIICANALRRNNDGYTSTSANAKGHTLTDYEKALIKVAAMNGWYFVDQFRMSGINDDTIDLTTIDGLHLNEFGYKLAVIPWVEMFTRISKVVE